MTHYSKTSLNQIRRIPNRGHYDQETIFDILDSALVCHVGIIQKDQPIVIPTAYIRIDNKILVHGSTKSRLLQYLEKGSSCCITVTKLEGLVLARSAFHHSMNYRSAVVFGSADMVEDDDSKLNALEAFTEKVVPGRWKTLRPVNQKELKATRVAMIDINSASAKIRTGPPVDDTEDYGLPIWAGEIPISSNYQKPIPDPKLIPDLQVPDHVEILLQE